MKKFYKITTVYGVQYKSAHADLTKLMLASWFCDVGLWEIKEIEIISAHEYFFKKGIDK